MDSINGHDFGGTYLEKQEFRDIGIALSLANLCLLKVWYANIFHSHHEYLFQWPHNPARHLANLLSLLGLGLVFWYPVFWARRRKSHFILKLARFAFLTMLMIPLEFSRKSILDWPVDRLLYLGKPILVCLGLVIVGFLVRYNVGFTRFAVRIVICLLPFLVPTVACSSWFFFKTIATERTFPENYAYPAQNHKTGKSRLLWIVFDELDQRVTFEKRPAGIDLTEFDRFQRKPCMPRTLILRQARL